MADITKCVNGCDKQLTCYRYTAPSSEYQAYSDFKPSSDGECRDYWPCEELTKGGGEPPPDNN